MRRLTFLLLCFLFSLSLFAQETSETRYPRTNLQASARQVVRVFPEEQLVPATLQLIQTYIDSGYLAARIDSIRLLNTLTPRRFAVYVYTDSLYYVCVGTDSLAWKRDAIEYLARSYAQQNLSTARIETLLHSRLQNLDSNAPTLTFATDESLPYPLASIVNHGELRMPPKLWYSLLGVKKGERLTSHELLHIDRVLASVPYLLPVSASSLELLDTGALRLHLNVAARKSHFVEGNVGFIPASRGKGVTFFGNAQMHLENLFNRGILFELRWMGKEREQQRGFLRFQYPYLWDTPWGIDLHLEAHLQDSVHYKWGATLGADYRINGFHKLTLSVERTQVQSTVGEEVKQNTALLWSLGHQYRAVIWRGEWQEGAEIQTRFSVGERENAQRGANIEGRYLFDAQYVRTLWRALYAGGGITLRGNLWRRTDALLLEGYPFGGTANFRGLQEASFFTPQYGYASFTSGVYLGNLFRLGVLMQCGELEYESSIRFALSYGGEVALRTTVGQLLLGMSRFYPIGAWQGEQEWLLHLQLRFTF